MSILEGSFAQFLVELIRNLTTQIRLAKNELITSAYSYLLRQRIFQITHTWKNICGDWKIQSAQEQEKKKIDASGWGEFILKDLFKIKHPCSRSQSQYEDGDVPYVSSGTYNNGIAAYLTPKIGEKLDAGNCITVSPLDGSSYWQASDFLGRGGSGASISMLYNTNLSQYNALFICAAIKAMSGEYGYDNLLNSDNLKTLKIKLPIASNGEPDWEYMENYMKEIEERINRQNLFVVNYN